jgi:hypothetical protein
MEKDVGRGNGTFRRRETALEIAPDFVEPQPK